MKHLNSFRRTRKTYQTWIIHLTTNYSSERKNSIQILAPITSTNRTTESAICSEIFQLKKKTSDEWKNQSAERSTKTRKHFSESCEICMYANEARVKIFRAAVAWNWFQLREVTSFARNVCKCVEITNVAAPAAAIRVLVAMQQF